MTASGVRALAQTLAERKTLVIGMSDFNLVAIFSIVEADPQSTVGA